MSSPPPSGRPAGTRPGCSRVRRRAGAGHARADGSLGEGLRQLGHLRHGVLPPLRPHAARVEEGRARGAAAGGVRASARRSRCWRAWRCTTSSADDEPFLRALRSHRARRRRRPQLRQEGRELGAAVVGRRNQALNDAAIEVADGWRSRRAPRRGGPAERRSRSSPARWCGEGSQRAGSSQGGQRKVKAVYSLKAVKAVKAKR